MESRRKGQTIHSEARNMISRIIKKCDEEARKGALLYPLRQARTRAADYTGVSLKTLSRIRQESIQSGEKRLPSPGRRRRPRCIGKRFYCSEQDRTIIRNIIYEYYVEKKIVPTCSDLLTATRERINFSWGKSTFNRLLKNMGFQYKQSNTRRKILIEDPNIVNWRSKYLKAMQHYRKQNKNIIYIDQMWFDNVSCCSKCWQSENKLDELQNRKTSHRLIMILAAGKSGFINGTDLIVKSQTTTDDDHKQVNNLDLEKWITDKLLPNIPPNSVIVIGSALYHNSQLNKLPSKYSQKKDMMKWLTENNIPYSKLMRKYELIEVIQQHKQSGKTHKLDDLIKEQGHSILRLLPYIRELNPIELAWAQIKLKVLEKTNVLTLACNDLEIFIRQALNEIIPGAWDSFCAQIEKVEQEYWRRDSILEDIMENLNLELQSSESDDSDDSDDSNSSNDSDDSTSSDDF